MARCSSCAREQEPRLICPECGAPLGVVLDCFAALEIPRKLQIDTDRLERTYHELGRRIHPDRFVASPAAVRDASLRSTALLTRSYRTIRDPVSRGLYWLELNGHKLAENNKSVPAELAELVFEVQEQLADMRAAREGRGAEAQRLRREVDERRLELQRMIEQAQCELVQNFTRWDDRDLQDSASIDGALVMELKTVLSKIAYLRTLVRDIDRELDSAQAA